MLAIGFTFLGGRYHATPWGRHVNEADIEWPPSAWRICRTLIATWHHKVDHAAYEERQLHALIEQLCEVKPHYRLPTAVHTHTRHYMPQYKLGKTKLVFDAFMRMDKTQELMAAWPGLELDASALQLLEELLPKIGYLGRAESWVEARLLTEPPALTEFTCSPGDEAIDTETGEVMGEIISLPHPVTTGRYKAWRDQEQANLLTGLKGKKKADMQKTMPDTLTAALSLDTMDFQQAGWSRPPASEPVHYLRPLHNLQSKAQRSKKDFLEKTYTTARFILLGKPLPRVEDALRIGEQFRSGLMGRAKQLFGEENIPPVLSGHDLHTNNKHKHAFYLPEDTDDDGYIDHIVVYAKAGFNSDTHRLLKSIRRLWNKQGGEWRLIVEDIGTHEHMQAETPLLAASATWISVTPYLHPWFRKPKFSIADQIRKECRLRGLPEPVHLEHLETINIKGRERRPVHFHRFRSKRGLTQPDTQGSFWRLTFAVPVQGPIVLGFACHYGLGMFKPIGQ